MRVSKAEQAAQQRDTPKNRYELDKARAEARYDVSMKRCNDQMGDAKSACKKEAKAERDMALANSKLESMSPAQASKRFGEAPTTVTPR